MTKIQFKELEIIVQQGDITELEVDAIVNAANTHFYMGGGVAGAIKRKGGKDIEKAAVQQGPVDVGETVITKGGALKAQYVIHAATMAMDFKTGEEIIRKATYNSLICAEEHNISSLAFCALGCGVGGFSYEATSKIMAQEVFRYVTKYKQPSIKRIIFVLLQQDALHIFEKNVCVYLQHLEEKRRAGPFVTVDGIVEHQGGLVLIERKNPPLGWALPGGFVDCGESVESAVMREVQEETSLLFKNFTLLGVYSKPERDPRFHTVSIVFYGQGEGDLQACSDAKAARVFSYYDLPERIAFDHRCILSDYIQKNDGKRKEFEKQ